MTTENFGKPLVAVRNTIYAMEPWEYFGDFLRDYAVIVFGDGWWKEEMTKPEAERHPVAQWRPESAHYMSTHPLQSAGSRRGVGTRLVKRDDISNCA